VEDIAQMVYTVAKSNFINGAIINVDGGIAPAIILFSIDMKNHVFNRFCRPAYGCRQAQITSKWKHYKKTPSAISNALENYYFKGIYEGI